MGQTYSFKTANCSTGPAGDILEKSEGNEKTTSSIDNKTAKGLATMESLHNTAHEIFPVAFEGLKVVLNQGLNQHFQLNHSWAFSGSEKQSGYKFGATYVGHNKISESEIYPIMLGELSPNGNLNAQIIHQLRPNIKCKYVSQMRFSKIDGQQLTVEYKHSDINLGLSIVNPSIKNEEVSVIVDLMRKMSDSISLGSMLVLQRSKHSQFSNFGIWNLGGQYRGKTWTLALAARPLQASFHSTFHIQMPDNKLQIATELEASLGQRQCVATTGYQYDLTPEVTIKSQIDTNWKIATSYERKFVTPIPFSLNLCINGDIWKSAYGLGVGFSLL